MTIERRNFPQFFITAPAPCPYLGGMLERKVFTHLIGQDALRSTTRCRRAGFAAARTSPIGRPVMDAVPVFRSECLSTNSDCREASAEPWLRISTCRRSHERPKLPPNNIPCFAAISMRATDDGGMADMTVLDFAAMVDESFVDTRIVEYRLSPGGREEREALVAAVLFDVLDDGLSLIYSFFDPDLEERSLGTYVILDSIHRAQRMGLSYVYLGYWVKGSSKMAYKARFLPQERLMRDGWTKVAG